MRSLSALMVLASATSLAACTFNPGAGSGTLTGGGTGNGGTTGTTGLGGRGGSVGRGGSTGAGSGGTGTPTEDANCGVQSQAIQNVPPDLLIVLDRSGSMEQLADGSACGNMCAMNKWAQMTTAIKQVVTTTDTTIRWGLKYFANQGTCGITNNAAVAPNIMTGMTIANNIDGTNTGGSTPTRLAMESATAYLNTVTDTNPKFILLATDGLPNCAPGAPTMQDDSAGAVTAVGAALTAGYPTFVVGIGTIAGGTQTLMQLATAGGRAPTAAPGYYQVNTTADLVAVLGTIQGMVASCTFSLAPPPPAPTNIAVHADANSIPKDTGHANGWDYNGTCAVGQTTPCSIQLYGSWCDRVMAKEFQNVQALYGCPDGPPVP